ncbi:MAG TPA: PAS domain S-box protein [Steroidobacteraceae bacterium]|nr:PAS domain S-box protein [Steroidobacteraceae bacterium]
MADPSKFSPLIAATDSSVDSELFVHVVHAVRDYAIFLLTPDGHIASWNTGARLIKGYEAAEILGKHFSTFYTPEDIARNWPAIELQVARREGRYEEEGWRIRKDGKRFWASVVITSLVDTEGTIRGFAKITRDLTQRLEQEQRLRESEERFRLLVNGVVDQAIFLLDPYGRVASWNPGAQHLKGYTAEEIIGRHFSVFYPPDAIERSWPARELLAAQAHGSFEDEGWRIRKDGTEFWANVLITALRGADGELRGYAKVTRDMTERDRVRALERSARHTDEFLAMLGHELRNPLGSIRNAAYIVAQVGKTPPLEKAGEILTRQLEHLTRMVDDLLDVSRIRSGRIQLQRQTIELQEVLRRAAEAVEPMIAARKHTLTLPADRGLTLNGDMARLVQLFTNLLNNAAKYTPPGGRIELAVKFDRGMAIVCVRDSGIGIPDHMVARVFDLFVQGERSLDRAEGGLGVGLALARKLAELHGGSLEARSDGEGKGSEFLVRLPAFAADRSNERPSTLDERASCKHVLVVDDQVDAADSLAMTLKLAGFDVETTYSGEDAVQKFDTLPYPITLLDIGLPGLNGYEVCKHIREHQAGTHPLVIAITGYGQHHDRERALAAGFDDHFVKPVDVPALLSAIRSRMRA